MKDSGDWMQVFNDVENIGTEINKINSNRGYWLVRSMGGDYYQSFKELNFIGIGYNDISLNEVKLAITKDDPQKELISIIQSKELAYNKSYTSSMLIKFVRDLKVDDIVLVPSVGSTFVSIGIISSDTYIEDNISLDDNACRFQKRKGIKWIKHIYKGALNPRLQLAFNSRHIISNIEDYSDYIDCFTNDFFQKDGKAYLVLRVKTKEEIALDNFSLLTDLSELVREYCEEKGIQFNPDDIKAKISVESPGDLVVFSHVVFLITLVGGFIYAITTGGTIKWKKSEGFELSGGNIFKSISEFLDRKKDRKFTDAVIDKMNNMEIENPNDLVKLIEEHNKKRIKY